MYFRERYDTNISPEQAEEYLNSLADLYLAFYSINNQLNNN